MIEITRIKNEQGENIGFRCLGHAGFARRGKDIVCAGVSAGGSMEMSWFAMRTAFFI